MTDEKKKKCLTRQLFSPACFIGEETMVPSITVWLFQVYKLVSLTRGEKVGFLAPSLVLILRADAFGSSTRLSCSHEFGLSMLVIPVAADLGR